MANYITYDDKVAVEPQTVHENQWWAQDANELKDKHNLNDDRITVLENVDAPLIYRESLGASAPFQFTVPDGYLVSTMSVMYISGTVDLVYMGSTLGADDLVYGLRPVSGDTVPRTVVINGEVAYGSDAQIYISIDGTTPVVNVYVLLTKIR